MVILIQKKKYIDESTGEIFEAKDKMIDVFNEDGYLFWTRKTGRRSYSDIRLSDYVQDRNDFLRVHLLAEYIYKDTNCIMYRESKRRIRCADIDDIARITGLTVRYAKDFVERMKKLEVIAVRVDSVGDTDTTKYLLNPMFFSSSRRLSHDLYFLFQKSLDTHLPSWVIRKFHIDRSIKNTLV